MNTINILKKMLWAAVILGLSVTGVFAQQTDVLPKGKYESIYIPEQNFQVGTMIYNADANKIASDFSSSGYALQTKSGATSFSSGRYDALPAYSLTSPAISLPQASDGEKLVLQLDQAFETEFQYDFVQVSVSEDGNSAAKLIYNNSGKTKRVDDYADLTAYAGKTVRLHFTINADATDAGKGWDIYNISVFKTGQTQAALKSSLRSANASRVARIEMLNVKSDNFPDEITAEFKAFDAAGNFVPGLDLSDFLLFDNNLNNLSCLKLVPDGIKQPVDVVFLVDNSGSMRTAMDKVNQNIEFLVTQLNQDFDLRVGLFRWGIDGGGNPPCPATNYSFEISNTGSGQDFWHLENSSNPSLSDFFSLVWDRNTVNGWYEPGWDALSHMANIQAGYRQNAQRVFILIGNEAVMDGTNQYDCQGNLTSQAQAIADLKREGIQTFTITANTTTSVADYKPIATATGGMWYDVNALDYSPILSAIGNVIADKYILTYCLNTDLEYVEVDDVCRPFEIQLKTTPTISDELCYTPQRMPSITRTAATKALDNVAQQQNRAITVAVDVCAPHTTIDRVVFRYKQHSQSVYTVQTLTAGTATGNGCYQYSATIPASAVQNPNVEYIFEAYFADGTMMKSPYPSSSFTSWVITVLPNLPPQISNVSVPAGQACTDITICAKIVDNTSNLVTKELHYRMQRTPSVFVSAPMMPCPSCGADYYCATIPRQAVDNDGVAYYIYAEDNFGSQGWHGNPENPQIITIPQVPASTADPMMVYVMTSSVNIFCEMIQPGDILKTYFVNDCGDYQLGGTATVQAGLGMVPVMAYGDSNLQDSNKNGFYAGDPIQVRVERNGYEYILQSQLWNNAPLLYVPNNQSVITQPIYGPGVPGIEITGNSQIINPGASLTSTSNGTDFGLCTASTMHTFTVTNTGCQPLTINGVYPDDAANFSASIAANTVIQPNQSATFTVTYKADATATTYINVINSASPAHFRFAVTGQKQNNNPNQCNMIISPNPVPSYGSNVTFTLNSLSTVTGKIYTTQGVLMQTFFGPLPMGAGTHSMYIQPYNLTPGQSYVLTIETNTGVCSSTFMMQ